MEIPIERSSRRRGLRGKGSKRMGKKLAIPACLQAKEWDRQKTIVGKFFKKKTGITEALKDFQKTYDSYGWAFVDSDIVSKWTLPKDRLNLAQAMKWSGQANDFCRLLDKKLASIKVLAHDNHGAFSGNPLIPKSAAEFLEKTWSMCDKFAANVHEQIQDSTLKIHKKLSGE